MDYGDEVSISPNIKARDSSEPQVAAKDFLSFSDLTRF
jgi:hypothetical protein